MTADGQGPLGHSPPHGEPSADRGDAGSAQGALVDDTEARQAIADAIRAVAEYTGRNPDHGGEQLHHLAQAWEVVATADRPPGAAPGPTPPERAHQPSPRNRLQTDLES